MEFVTKIYPSFQLEQQVSELKRRLDELRKAKNTTIVKKGKECVTTGAPQSPHNNSTTANCASEQRAPSMDTANEVKLQQSKQEIKTLQDNISAMKELHRAEIEELRNETEKQVLLLWIIEFTSYKPTQELGELPYLAYTLFYVPLSRVWILGSYR